MPPSVRAVANCAVCPSPLFGNSQLRPDPAVLAPSAGAPIRISERWAAVAGTDGQVLRYQEGRYRPLLGWHHELLETVPSIVTGALRAHAVGGLEPAGE